MAPIMTRVVQIQATTLPLRMVGSNIFGRYPKISAEKTFNMFESDGWLIPTPGHIKVANIDPLSEGRGIFTSVRAKKMFAVIGNKLWSIDEEIKEIGVTIDPGDVSEQIAQHVGSLETYTGDVFIDENDVEEIGISDKKNIYVYNYSSGVFQKVSTDFTSGYIASQDGRLISPVSNKPSWRLSNVGDALTWPSDTAHEGEFQTKPDNVKACVRVPGKGNQLFIMGQTVTEPWNDVGYKLFPYYRTNSFNIDYGCLNQATIATGDKFVIWLGENEKSGPVIMYSDGGPEKQISPDGMNFSLAQLKNPEDSYGFLYKNDGHLFYQLTLRKDKITYLYDFNTSKFYFLTDEKMENHIAKKVTFFAGDYYFISFIDGNIYRLSSDATTYDGKLIPRIRITNTIRTPKDEDFIANKLGFAIEQGEDANISRVDISLSYDGGVSFGNIIGHELNVLGNRQNKFTEWNLGRANEFTAQFRFWGDGRFVCKDGYLEIYK
jgi:hypothetical protein